MKKVKTKSELSMARRIKSLQYQLDEIRKDRDKIELDRNKYRDFVMGKFKWWVKLLTANSNPCLKWLIKDTAGLFNRCDKFYTDWTSE